MDGMWCGVPVITKQMSTRANIVHVYNGTTIITIIIKIIIINV
jgi:hypothetical protein